MLQQESRKRIVIISIVVIAIALISLIPLLNTKATDKTETITGNVIAEKGATTTTIINYLYLMLIILVPIATVGILSYAYTAKKEMIDTSFDIVLHNEEQQKTNTINHSLSLDEYFEAMRSKQVPTSENNLFDVDVLQNHIKSRLLRGYSSEEIYYELIKHGWKKEKISHALNQMQVTPIEAEVILGSFIAKSMAQGHDLLTIKESLVARGWQPETINSAAQRFEETVK